MAFDTEINKLMLVDGLLFLLQGVSMMLSPNPQGKLKTKIDVKVALPPFKDVRASFGAAFTSMGFLIAALAGIITQPAELNGFAKFRAISLVFIIYAAAMQMIRKNWKWRGSTPMYLVFYILLLLLYVFFGFIDPLPTMPL